MAPIETMWMFGCNALGPHALDLLDDLIPKLPAYYPEQLPAFIVSGLEPEGCLYRDLRRRYDSRFNIRKYRSKILCAASLEGGIEGWLSRRSSNFRRNLKRAERRAQAGGTWFERAQPSSEIDADRCYDRMLAVEEKSWKGPRREGLLAVRAFYETLLRAYAERGAARVVFAKQADEDVGFCFGGASHGIYRGQQTSYSDELAGLSIGTLMHFETAKWLAEDGARLQHFGPIQRMMSYKHSFCEIELPSLLSVFRG
ncbi:MAG: GNAT family N-acetyltransferase [Hyphomonas oceanitis]|uniref:GNAT family N-acetyltransferase n=1 Tax=Hyphomonas oceanitis TaxID=81033 RepID=UPI003001BFBA